MLRKIIIASAFSLVIFLGVFFVTVLSCLGSNGRDGTAKNEVSEEKQEVHAEESKPTRWQLYSQAVEYYTGTKGVPQNYKKAEELFRQAAEEGAFFAPAYISALLAHKYDRLPQLERRAIARECYFWTLIALAYLPMSNQYDEGRYGVFSSLESKKQCFESNMALWEIEEIQDQATKWCEDHKN